MKAFDVLKKYIWSIFEKLSFSITYWEKKIEKMLILKAFLVVHFFFKF